MVNFANSYQKIIGKKNHKANQGELINLQNLGTSLYAKSDFSAGSTTSLCDYEIKAPRTGISVGDFVSNYENQALISNISKGESLSLRHFSGKAVAISEITKNFARQVGLGLPVRLHDYSSIKNNFDINTYEFHLSFSEVLSDKLNNIVDEINRNEISQFICLTIFQTIDY